MIRLILISVVFMIAVGCGGSSPGAGAGGTERTTSIDEAQAIEIAREAVRQNDTFADSATYEAKPAGNGWQISVWQGQRGQGTFRLVVIDGNGDIVQYNRGG